MPLYSAQCDECGAVKAYFRKVDDRALTPECHGPMTKRLDAPMVSVMAWTGHKGFNLAGPNGKWIEDGAAFKKYMDENNVVPESEGLQEATLQKSNREKADDKKLDAAVIQAIQKSN